MRNYPATMQKRTNNQASKFELKAPQGKQRGLLITKETRNQIMQRRLKCLHKYSLKHETKSL